MKFEAKNLSPVAFHALICVEVSVSIKCFDWSKMAAEVFPVACIDEYAKPCEPAIHVLRSVLHSGDGLLCVHAMAIYGIPKQFDL